MRPIAALLAAALSIGLVGLATTSCKREVEPELSGVSVELGQRLGERVDEGRLLESVRRQVEFGPRPSGSAALAGCRDWMAGQLEEAGWQVVRQEFEADTVAGPRRFVNLRARFGAGARNWQAPVDTLYGTHYDTKPYENIEFLGANDGGSGTAVLLEFARVLAADELGRPLAEGVELVFFDGEEAVAESIDPPRLERPLSGEGLWGSRHYAIGVREGELPEPGRVVIWDIVGDGDSPLHASLDLRRDLGLLNQLQQASEAVRGRPLRTGVPVIDDHTPFQMLGLPAADVIQADLVGTAAQRRGSYWHTEGDTLEVVDGEALATATRLALQLIVGRR